MRLGARLPSARSEGPQPSPSDLLPFELVGVAGVLLDDVREVANYVAAMNHGWKRLEALPHSLRLWKEIHGVTAEAPQAYTENVTHLLSPPRHLCPSPCQVRALLSPTSVLELMVPQTANQGSAFDKEALHPEAIAG